MSTAAPLAVTGASGFLGRALLKAAAHEGIPVRALSRQQQPDAPGVEWIKGEITDAGALTRLVAGSVALVHAAATLQGSDETVYQSIVAGTEAAARSALTAGVRLIHISSLAVVDPALTGQPRAIGDEPALDPRPEDRGGYTRGKIEAERSVAALRGDGLEAVIVRPAQLVGAELAAVPPSIGVAVAGCRVGLARMSAALPLVHVDDAATAILLIAMAVDPAPAVNLVDPLLVSRRLLLQRLRQEETAECDLPLIPIGPLLQPLAKLLDPILPGRLGRAGHRIATIENRATWPCNNAMALGWRPRNLEPWLQQSASTSVRP